VLGGLDEAQQFLPDEIFQRIAKSKTPLLCAVQPRIVQSIFGEIRLLMQPFLVSRERRDTAHKI
jgi:hypothetical protein